MIEAEYSNSKLTAHTEAAIKVGRILSAQRRQAKVTGQLLAEELGVSQSRVSKIENGAATISVKEINDILAYLKCSRTIQQQVELLLASAIDDIVPVLQPVKFGFTLHGAQAREHVATRTDIFAASGVPALLQTVPYREAILRFRGLSDARLQAALHTTLHRQDELWGGNGKYHMLVHESALYTLYTSVAQHVEQLDRLERMSDIHSLNLGIVPLQSGMTRATATNFALYDNRLLVRELAEAEYETTDDSVIAMHIQQFKEIQRSALYGAPAKLYIRKAIDHYRLQGTKTKL